MKRVLSVLLVLCLTLTLTPGLTNTVWADEIASGYCGNGLTWSLDSDGVMIISGDGPLPDYKNYEPAWYSYREDIYKVVLESGVTAIGWGTFRNCTAMTSIEIKGSVSSIGERAFSRCLSLKEISLPEGLKTIGMWAFYMCSGMTDITLPEGLESIGQQAFYQCTSLQEITIPDSVTTIIEEAFKGCSGLTSVTIGSGLTKLDKTFSGCTGLTEVIIPENITDLGGAFIDCTGLTKVSLPDTVVSIGRAFEGCTGLTEAVIPLSVTNAAGAYSRCTGITEAVIPDSVINASGIFSGCTNLKSVKIGKGVTDISSAFAYCTSLEYVTVPNTVTELAYTFCGCSSLKELTIPNSVKTIRDSTFKDCTSLTEITIPDSVELMDVRAFQGCSGLNSLVIGDGINKIYGSTFEGCSSLTDVSIGAAIHTIDNNAFSNCSSLTTIRIPGNVRYLYENVFSGCTKLKEVTFTGNAPESIGQHCFTNVKATVYYSENDSSWTEDIFQDYGGKLTWVACKIPVVIVASGQCGDDLFWTRDSEGTLMITGTGPMWDYSLEKPAPWRSTPKAVMFETGATSVGEYAFADCDKLVSAVLPDTLTDIGRSAFLWDRNLYEITLPESLVSIGEYAFQQCEGLKRAVFSGSAPELGEGVFWGDSLAAYYNDQDESWYHDGVRQDYGGRICWAGCMADPNLPERMAGNNRQGTAVAISKAAFPDGAENVVIASGDNYPDALAGGPLAYMLDAPILLVCKSKPDQATLDEIKRLGARHAYILGGTGAVSDGVADTLRGEGLTIERIAGPSRFETAVAVAEKMDELRGGKPAAAFFVYSHNYPDALAVSNVAAIAGVPILYIEKNGVMRDSIKKYMDSCGSMNINVIIGGPALISTDADTALKKYGEVERIYGSNRYETCVFINAAFSDILDGDSICVACGTNYPDALSGSVLAAFCHAPLLLVSGNTINQLQQEYVYWKAPLNVFAFGGTGVLTQAVISAIKEYAL